MAKQDGSSCNQPRDGDQGLQAIWRAIEEQRTATRNIEQQLAEIARQLRTLLWEDVPRNRDNTYQAGGDDHDRPLINPIPRNPVLDDDSDDELELGVAPVLPDDNKNGRNWRNPDNFNRRRNDDEFKLNVDIPTFSGDLERRVTMGPRKDSLRTLKVDGTTYNPSDGRIHLANWSYGSLKVLVEKMGPPQGFQDLSLSTKDVLHCCQLWKSAECRIATLEFDRDRKSMGVIATSKSNRNMLLVKGAVENVLERNSYMQLCDGTIVRLDQSSRDLILQSLNEMSTTALRCLGFAYKEPSEFATYNVHKAIEDCRGVGIRVTVITGDNKNTSEAICREIGVFGPYEDNIFMIRKHLNQNGRLLFSRVEPRHKQEIVKLLKEDGEVVAMTGDGVNDAPALKLVDIGIAMSVLGTEVAKEAIDMVLADDKFSTIVAIVGEGRSIYNNMEAFIKDMISNIGEVASIFLTTALGIPEGLIPVHLLWVNLVTDGPPATALGFNPPDKDIMKKPPRRSKDSLITAWILFRYLVIGSYVGIATVGVFIIWYTHGSFLGIDLSQDGNTLVTYSQLSNWGQCPSGEGFTVTPFTAGSQVFSFDANPCDYFQVGKVKMFNSLNALSEDGSLLTMPPWVNPWLLLAMSVSFGLHFLILYVPFLAQVFGIVPLSLNEWLLVLAVAFPVVLIDEILKFVGKHSKL
uniref:Cation-transporting P-type ATPase C-terminal domain-containing protein n=1 Tax=Nelumbo nucifera TaxID=4432 RepID=A0A822XDG1_NELNU|nr:TPA_asm: hypothetical protein HUJ06_019395 [Nelumbo nucifera]